MRSDVKALGLVALVLLSILFLFIELACGYPDPVIDQNGCPPCECEPTPEATPVLLKWA